MSSFNPHNNASVVIVISIFQEKRHIIEVFANYNLSNSHLSKNHNSTSINISWRSSSYILHAYYVLGTVSAFYD